MSLNVHKIPVFVFPTALKFYIASRSTHKQLLTLYNPYDFPVRFKVLCNAPNKYAVIDPEGSIGPKSCVDIVIRHTIPLAANCNVTDKFRISMQDHATKQVLGRRDIEATLLQGEGDNSSNDGDNFQNVQFDRTSTLGEQRTNFLSNRSLPATQSANHLICVAIGIVCVVALLLPTQQDLVQPVTNIPSYLHISVNFKLVLAYVLGLVSMVVFRP